jgi:hypothetical protein
MLSDRHADLYREVRRKTEAYFDWLAWVLFAILAMLCLINCSPLRRRWVGVTGVCLGLADSVVTIAALWSEGPRAVTDGSPAGVFRDSRPGLWLAIAGYLIAGVGVFVMTLQQRVAAGRGIAQPAPGLEDE